MGNGNGNDSTDGGVPTQTDQGSQAAATGIEASRQGVIIRGRDSGFLSDTDGKERKSHDTIVTTVNGTRMVTIATQTSEIYANSSNPYAHLSADNGSMPTAANINVPQSIYHGAWPMDRDSAPIRMIKESVEHQETASMVSFSSSGCSGQRKLSNAQLGTKVEMVYSLLSMLGTHDKDDMSRTLLAMSSSLDSCIAMRQSGCLPLLIQLLHGPDKDSLLGDTRGSKEARVRAAAALHNIVHSHPDEKRRRLEARVLRLLEQIRAYCDSLGENADEEDSKQESTGNRPTPIDHHPGPAVAALMKLSFDEEHRSAMCQLGGLHAIAELLQLDYNINPNTHDQYSVTLRRYAGMALTNLTFGDGANKALLCSLKGCMHALVAQLKSESEDLRQVVASVVRNLSWRADLQSKKVLREVSSVTALMESALQVKKESTLKSILSALWNLSAHCTENKADICAVEGALAFLVETLQYKSASRTLTVIENAGGILRNVSSHIATREEYRQTLRDHNCLQILLSHLASPSLTIVSNACGTLWNLSARNQKDQELLWDLNAVSMLRNLVNSKHKMIAMGSSAALRNLLAARPEFVKSKDFPTKDGMPSLHVRKQRALEADIEKNLADNNPELESPKTHPRDNKSETDVKDSTRILPRRLSLRPKMFSPGTELSRTQDNRHRSRSPRGHSPNRVRPHIMDNRLASERSRSSSIENQELDNDNRNILDNKKEPEDNKKVDSLEKRGGRQKANKASTRSRIAKVMQEVAMHAGITETNKKKELEEKKSVHKKSKPTNVKSVQPAHKKPHCTRSNSFTFTNSDASNLTSRSNSFSFGIDQGNQMYSSNKRTSNESINSVTSDIYPVGAHTRLPYRRPPIDHSFSVDDTLNALSNQPDKRYDYHHAIQKVEDDLEGDMDTTINFSLKYSDESITPGRQSPTVEVYQHDQIQKPSRENYLNVSDHYDRMLRSDGPNKYRLTYDEAENPEEPEFNQYPEEQPIQGKPTTDFTVQCQDCNMPHRHRESMASGHLYSECALYNNQQYRPPAPVNESYKPDFESDRPTNYIQYSDSSASYEDPHDDFACGDQPTDFTQKYATDLPDSFETEHMPPDDSAMQPINPVEDAESNGCTVSAKKHNEKLTNYCLEDTPVCFSNCSSLSSLHSNDIDESGEQIEHPSVIDNTASVRVEDSMPSNKKVQSEMIEDDEDQNASTEEVSGSGTYTPDTTDLHHEDKELKEDNFIEETPLVFSRCSSLSSLSSFELHSLHDDRSSVYSSHRASEVVSPSDLPDSPSEPMIPSPKRIISKPKQTAQQHNILSKLPTALPKPADDASVEFCTEGTPLAFSGATSLSSLSIEGEERIVMDPELKTNHNDSTTATIGTDANTSRQDIADVDLSGETTEAEQSILEDCIFSAMPPKKQTSPKSKVRSKLQKSASSPHTTKHVSFSQHVFSQDAPQTFCTEDTPLNFSTATSLSDLSIEDIEIKQGDDGKMTIGNPTELQSVETRTVEPETPKPAAPEVPEDPRSETSSVLNESDSNMLAECINSAMPKPRINKAKSSYLNKRKAPKISPKPLVRTSHPPPSSSRANSAKGSTMRTPSTVPSLLPVAQSTCIPPIVKSWNTYTPPDTMTTYCTEGTPLNFSTATSMSDLSVDSPQNEDVVNGNTAPKPDQPVSRENLDSVPKMQMNRTMHVMASSGSSPYDSPQAFAVEGTPMSFSRNDSLSSLSCDEDLDLGEHTTTLKGLTSVMQTDVVANPEQSKKMLPKPVMRKTETGVKRMNQSKVGNTSNNVTYNPRRASDEVPANFTVEDTPLCFSRNSSLSSLSDIDNNDGLTENQSEQSADVALPSTNVKSKDMPRNFAVEDTPVCFSRNSSLSSLSLESLNLDPTPSEQALLNDCINAAMPAPKPKNSRQNKGSKLPACQPMIIKPNGNTNGHTHRQIPKPGEFRKEQHEFESERLAKPQGDFELENNPADIVNQSQDQQPPIKRRPLICKPGDSVSKIRLQELEEKESEPRTLKGGKKVYKSPYAQNGRASSVPRSTPSTVTSGIPQRQGTPAGRGRGVSPHTKNAASKANGRGRATSAPATRCSTPTPGSRNSTPPPGTRSAGATPRGTPPRTASPSLRSGAQIARPATTTQRTATASSRTVSTSAIINRSGPNRTPVASGPKAAVAKSAIPRTGSPVKNIPLAGAATKPPLASTATRNTNSAYKRNTTSVNKTTPASGIAKPAVKTTPRKTSTTSNTAPTSRTGSPATRGAAKCASPSTNGNRSGVSSAAASRSSSPAARTTTTRSISGPRVSNNNSRQNSLSRTSSKDSVTSSVASKSPRNSISSPSPKTMSPTPARRQLIKPVSSTSRSIPTRLQMNGKQSPATSKQKQTENSQIAKTNSSKQGTNKANNVTTADKIPQLPKLQKQSTFTKESPSQAGTKAAAANAATGVSNESASKNEEASEVKPTMQRVSPWRRTSPVESRPTELNIAPGKQPNVWKKTRETPELPETQNLSPNSLKLNSGSDTGSSQSSPTKRRYVSKNEYDIPVINYGGNISSPASDASPGEIWVKRENCPINSPTASRPSSLRMGSQEGSIASSPSGSLHRIISPVSQRTSLSGGSSLQNVRSNDSSADYQSSETSEKQEKNDHRKFVALKRNDSLKNKRISTQSINSENEKTQSEGSSPSPTNKHSPRGSPKKNKKKSKNDYGSGSCGAAPNDDHEQQDVKAYDVISDNFEDEGIMGIDMELEPELISDSDLLEDEEEPEEVLDDQHLFEEEEEEEDYDESIFQDDEQYDMTEPEPSKNDAAPQEHPPQEKRQVQHENRLNSFILINDSDNSNEQQVTSPTEQPEPTATQWRRKSSSRENSTESEPASPKPQKMPATRKPPLSNGKPASQTVKPVMVSPFNYTGPLPSKSQQQSSSQQPSQPMSPEGTPTRRTMIPRPVSVRGGGWRPNKKGENEDDDDSSQNGNSRSFMVTSV
ncbi:adenomatous polyposis coli protein [Saccoglossus kowalevskii]